MIEIFYLAVGYRRKSSKTSFIHLDDYENLKYQVNIRYKIVIKNINIDIKGVKIFLKLCRMDLNLFKMRKKYLSNPR